MSCEGERNLDLLLSSSTSKDNRLWEIFWWSSCNVERLAMKRLTTQKRDDQWLTFPFPNPNRESNRDSMGYDLRTTAEVEKDGRYWDLFIFWFLAATSWRIQPRDENQNLKLKRRIVIQKVNGFGIACLSTMNQNTFLKSSSLSQMRFHKDNLRHLSSCGPSL